MFYFFLLGVAALGGVIYFGIFMSHVPGATEERFGALEPLPEPLNEWVTKGEPSADGLIVQERYLFEDTGGFAGGKLTLQVRYRDAASNEIVRIDPEKLITRKRVKPS